jgi:hypothetical protein
MSSSRLPRWLSSEDYLRQIKTFYFREFLDRPRALFMGGPEAQTTARRSAAGAARPLVGSGTADFSISNVLLPRYGS